MEPQEIFTRLNKMRNRIETDTEEPLLDSDNALLYDVAKALGLTDGQAATLAGDNESSPQPSRGEPRDFDSGLGIGGLGRHQEKPIIPTVAQMERMEKLEAQATTCRRCGQSDLDGAMFTTGGGGSICDDCF